MAWLAEKRAVGDGQRAVVIDGAAEAVGAEGLVGRQRAVGDSQRAIIKDGAAVAVAGEGEHDDAAGGMVVRQRAVGDGQRAVVKDGTTGAGHAAVLQCQKLQVERRA